MTDRMTIDGLALVASSLTFFVGASLAPEPSRVFSVPREAHLTIVARHAGRWRAMNLAMIAGVSATAVALWLLGAAGYLSPAGLPLAGAAAYSVVAPLWLAALAIRSTITVDVARRLADGGAIPDWYEPFESLAGLFFRAYLLIAYPAMIAIGVALVRHHVAPGAGWSAIVIGVVAETNIAVGRPEVMGGPAFEPPFIVHVPPLVIGIGLLLRG